MKTSHLPRDDARRALRAAWEHKTDKYSPSPTDCYTDGFWDGRLWAAARLLEALPELDRARVIELLELHPREIEDQGI